MPTASRLAVGRLLDDRDELVDQRVAARRATSAAATDSPSRRPAAAPRRPWCRRVDADDRAHRRAAAAVVEQHRRCSSTSGDSSEAGTCGSGLASRPERRRDGSALPPPVARNTTLLGVRERGEGQRHARDERLEPRFRDPDDQPRALRQRRPDRGTSRRCARRARCPSSTSSNVGGPPACSSSRSYASAPSSGPSSPWMRGAPPGAGVGERVEQRLLDQPVVGAARRRARRSGRR